MTTSTAVELEAFVSVDVLSFVDFGNATQSDLEALKNELNITALAKVKLQSIWARHPLRQSPGKKCRFFVTPY
jgi:ABC-type thiamine transport system ATPase subunit